MSSEDALAEQAADMVADVDRFLNGAMTIDRLSTALKIRLAAMEAADADTAWIDELRSLRNQIEYVNAFWLESGRGELDSDELRIAMEAAQELKAALSGG
jgi:hypothetical protein